MGTKVIEVTSCKDCPLRGERRGHFHARIPVCHVMQTDLDFQIVYTGGVPVLCPLNPLEDDGVVEVRLAPRRAA